MLEAIRKHAQGWFAWAIIIMISIPFALWGINQYFEGGGRINAASVNGHDISADEFQQAYQRQRDRMQAALGKNFDPSLINDEELKKNVLEGLVERSVMLQAAHDGGLRVSGARIGAEIRAIPSLQSNGQFDKELYGRLLRSQGLTISGFEQLVGDDLVIRQLTQGIAESGFVTQAEVDALLRIQVQRRDIGYVLVPVMSYLADAEVDDAAIEKYYKGNTDRFRTVEAASVEYLELSVDDIAKGVQVTEPALQDYYQERAASFTTPEERHARHILIEVASDAPPAEVEAARNKAEDLLARIHKGESFEDLAKQYSQDPGSAQSGGDLGFFGLGMMDKAFEQAAYALKVGEVSEPVRSTFGFHLIKLEGVRGGEIKPYEAVRADLERDYKRQQADEQFFAQAETLSNMAFEQSDNLTAAATALHLTVQTSGLFSRDNGTGIASNPKVRDAAFGDEVLLGGKNSEAIELAPDHIVVLRIKEHRPAAVHPLEEVRAEIRQALRLDAARDKAMQNGEALLKRVQAGENADTVAAELKLKWARSGFVSRQESGVNAEVVDTAFRLARPEEGKPVFGGKALSSGDYAIVGLYAVKDGDPAGIDNNTVQSLKENLAREYGQGEFKGYVDALKAKADISRHLDKL